MIIKLKGTIEYKGNGFIVVDCNNIGYKVIFPDHIIQDLSGDVVLYTHEVVRDDQRELFGFHDLKNLEFFWKLTSVSGVGSRLGQKIIYSGAADNLKSNIMAGNIEALTSISGVGKKTAQKIILELKGALVEEPEFVAYENDALDALMGLGYSRKQAEDAIFGIEADTTEEIIKIALKGLSR